MEELVLEKEVSQLILKTADQRGIYDANSYLVALMNSDLVDRIDTDEGYRSRFTNL